MQGSVRVRREREDEYASNGSDDDDLSPVRERDTEEDSDEFSTGAEDASSEEDVSGDYATYTRSV